ncbi:MAG TPA: ABC transporter permease [Aggregatilineaceae bacterium]|nr:ABC transporter permease [Aggregatilineaceae bacterium]
MGLEATAEPLPLQAARKRRTREKQLILLGSRFWSWLFLVLLIICFSWQAGQQGTNFFSLRNSQVILVNIVSIVLMGLGQTFVIISGGGGIDLSVGWIMGLSSVISAKTIRDGWNAGIDPPIAILLGLATGLAVALFAGLVSGIIIAKLRVPPFIVTLGVSFVARGVGFLLAKGNIISGQPQLARDLGNESLLYHVRGDCSGVISPLSHLGGLSTLCGRWYALEKPAVTGAQLRSLDRVITYPVLIAAIVVAIGLFILAKTQFGRHTYAIGGSREAALRAGVPVDRHLIRLYMMSAGTSGLAGVMHAWRFSGGAADAGDALMMMSIAAVVIGGVSMFGGEGRVIGTVIGALILAVLQSGLIMINVKTFYQYVVVGIIVIMAVLIDQARDLVIGRAESE